LENTKKREKSLLMVNNFPRVYNTVKSSPTDVGLLSFTRSIASLLISIIHFLQFLFLNKINKMSYWIGNRRPAALKPSGTLSSTSGMADKDVTLSSPPEDSISDLSWSPKAQHLAVAAWDNKVRIYDLTNRPGGEGMTVINFEKPVLSCAWSDVCHHSSVI
jgi:WD40 repeat protein